MSIAWFQPLVQTMRPRQWIKNGLLFIPLIFDKQLTNWPSLGRVTLGFVLFCILSSLVYIINDLMDFEADRNHPQKRLRPIAAGNLQVSTARVAIIALALAFFIPAIWLSPEFALIGLTYLALNLAYSAWLKHTPILDVMILASFYVLRVGAGVVLIDVHQFSPWLYVFTTFLALFLGIGKRRAELYLLAGDANSHRKVLEGYTIPLLDQLILVVSSSTIITYSLYTFSGPNLPANNVMMLTIPFVIYGIFRYLYLVQLKQIGGEPEEVLFTDRPLQLTILLWGFSILFIYYLTPG
ncbi:MAG: phosphoribose diphosphate--decaprenyl-phosphate phosphoribosyltransferase [Chloroflexi bacterium RBG_19FT_COMBO_50_10]|nr:MAG: phosphoribose diphosphate--decaprenyl-phosphate phosphoribosyltransferase [Chloroflexi bacterium RBG_19FT_COMBO_50_10]